MTRSADYIMSQKAEYIMAQIFRAHCVPGCGYIMTRPLYWLY